MNTIFILSHLEREAWWQQNVLGSFYLQRRLGVGAYRMCSHPILELHARMKDEI